MRISLLLLIAAATLTLNACSKSNGNGGGAYSAVSSPEPEYNSRLTGGKAYTGKGDFTDIAELRFEDLGVEQKPHDERDACYSYTKYPIVLVHGLYGFDDILGVKLTEGIVPGKGGNELQPKPSDGKGIDYWYKVAEAIELGGGIAITLPVPKLNSTEVRGEALIDKLGALAAAYPNGLDSPKNCGEISFDKFHLMGHSHGGPTVRYVLEKAPHLAASITTIGGVNVYGIPETTPKFAYKELRLLPDDQPMPTAPLTPVTRKTSDSIYYPLCTLADKEAEEGKFKPGELPDQCNHMADFTSKLTSFAYGPIYQGSLNLLAEIIEFVGGNAQNDQSNGAASLTSLSAMGISEYNTHYNLGLPEYYKLFLYDENASEPEGPLFALGLQDPCQAKYYENSSLLFGDPAIFGSDADSCEQSLHGAPFVQVEANSTIEKTMGDTPDSNSIFLFSWSGVRHTDMNPLDPSDRLTAITSCLLAARRTEDSFIQKNASNSFKKISDSLLQFLGLQDPSVATADPDYEKLFLCEDSDIVEPSDGMVQQFASHFGTVLRSDYKLNHVDEINWFLGSHNNSFTPLAIYRIQANRIQQLEQLYDL